MSDDTKVRVKMIAHPRDTEAGQRFIVREASLAAVDIDKMSNAEFVAWVTEEGNSLGGNQLEFVE